MTKETLTAQDYINLAKESMTAVAESLSESELVGMVEVINHD